MSSQPITRYQFRKLIKITKKENNRFIALRDSLMYEFAYYLGLRPMEIRCIRLSHINFQEHILFIPAENNKERNSDNFPISKRVFIKLITYLKKRKTSSEWLFPCYWNHDRKQDVPVDKRTFERNFSRRIMELGFIQCSFIDRQNLPRYNLNLYSFRKRFGTAAYKKFKCPKRTANLLRQYDPSLQSVWRYIYFAENENRGKLLNKIPS